MSVEAPVMQILINGQADLVSADPGARFGQVVEEVRQWLLSNSIAILEMRLDGEVLDSIRQADISLQTTEDFETLEIDVVEIAVLAQEVLSSIYQHLPLISQRLIDITARIQGGQTSEAFTLLDDVLEAWGLVLGAIDNLRRLYSVAEVSIAEIDRILAGKEERLRTLLEEIRDAFEDRDLVTVGDCLEYELSPMVADWVEVVDALQAVLATPEKADEPDGSA